MKCWFRMETTPANNSKDKYQEQINQVFTHCGKDEEIDPLTKKEITEAQTRDRNLKKYFKLKTIMTKNDIDFTLLKTLRCMCNDGT